MSNGKNKQALMPLSIEQTEPRPARNLPDLLRYATEVTEMTPCEKTGSQVISPDKEKMQFLNKVMSSMTTNINELLEAEILSLEKSLNVPEVDDDVCDAAFDRVLDLVGQIDFANDYHKLGGFRIFKQCLQSSSELVRWRCCELIAELCQNNPYCQTMCLQEGYLPLLIARTDEDPADIVRVKAMYAISCLVRENEETTAEFIKLDGVSLIFRALHSNITKLQVKSAFLLSSLCSSPHVKVDEKFIEQLIASVRQSEDDAATQCLIDSLKTVVSENSEARQMCSKPQHNLKLLLKSKTQADSCSDLMNTVKEVLKLVFGEE